MIFLLFIFGLFTGSFLGVLADRIPVGRSVVFGRSSCDSCGKKIAWYDLFPLFSFVWLRGKCRNCQKKISYRYMAAELLTGTVFALVGWWFTQNAALTFDFRYWISLVYYLFIFSVGIVICLSDLRYRVISNVVVFPAIFVSFLYVLFFSSALLFNHMLSALGAFLFFYTLYFITKKKGMGFGDVILSLFLGMFLGFPYILLALYVAFVTGSIVALFLMLGRKWNLRDAVPFGPFLIFGFSVAFFLGDYVLRLVL